MCTGSFLGHRAEEFHASDLDARFIFSWIALNALYGQAKYRHGDAERTPEFRDLEAFLELMLRWDSRAIDEVLRSPDIGKRADDLLRDKFLSDVAGRSGMRKGSLI